MCDLLLYHVTKTKPKSNSEPQSECLPYIEEAVGSKDNGYNYTCTFKGITALFQIDGAPQPWENAPIPDGLVLGKKGDQGYVIFVELKSVQIPSQRSGSGVPLRAQLEKASRQLISGIYHFHPICKCHSVQGNGCRHSSGEQHHAQWHNLDAIVPNIATDYRGHEVRGVVILFRINLQRSIEPPEPPKKRKPLSSQLGGSHICPAKPIPRFKILYRSLQPDGTAEFTLDQLVSL